MRVRRIRLARFTTHDLTEVVLPEAGVVVVTGPNGAGKSALVEAVACAVWGKTLRGVPGWRVSDSGVRPTRMAGNFDFSAGVSDSGAEVETDVFRAARWKRGAASPRLGWELRDDTEEGRAARSAVRLGAYGDAGEYLGDPLKDPGGHLSWESSSHAQAALDRMIPTFEVWRRTCVFSSSDAAHFSLASDGERKRLLEAVLGLLRFDPALEACRADLRNEEREVVSLETQLATERALLAAAERELAEARRALGELGDEDPEPAPTELGRDNVRRELRDAEAALRLSSKNAARLGAELRELSSAEAVAVAEVERLRRELARAERGTCAACGQAVPAGRAGEIRVRLEAAVRAPVPGRPRELVEEELDEEHEVESVLLKRAARLRAELGRWEDLRRLRNGAAAERHRAEARVRAKLGDAAAASMQIANALEPQLAAAKLRAQTLAEVEKALGLRGVRAQVLARALGGVSASARSWLARLGKPGLRVELLPGTERKGGGVVDAISVQVSGAGGGHGYRGASAGERRRVDVALLLALADVAGAAAGTSPSTLFLDELFDGLDAEGREDAARLVGELGRDRCVVLVTHDAELARRVPAVRRLRVEAGVVSEAA